MYPLELSRSPDNRASAAGGNTMAGAYIGAYKSSTSLNMSKGKKSQVSMKKKEVSDSNIFGGKDDDFEDSCIVNDDAASMQENKMLLNNLQKPNHKSVSNLIGKVGMSSKMSSKVSLVQRVSVPGGKNPNSQGALSSLEIVDPMILQKSMVRENMNNFASKTMDNRLANNFSVTDQVRKDGFKSFSSVARNTKMSCMTKDREFDLNITKDITEQNFSNSIVPNIILAQSVKASVKPSQKLLWSPEFNQKTENTEQLSNNGSHDSSLGRIE